MKRHDLPDDYHARPRDDLFGLLPKSPGLIVLDVGCGEGSLARRLKQLGQVVWGIELSSQAAAKASRFMDRVLIGDAERMALDLSADFFDAIVLGDILEHLYDPWEFMRKMRRCLKPGGVAVASIPNIQYFPIVTGLICGRFRYAAHGILDITHLRFFTHREAARLFKQSGFSLRSLPRIYPYRHRMTRKAAGLFDRLTLGVFGNFLVGNIIIVGQKARSYPTHGETTGAVS